MVFKGYKTRSNESRVDVIEEDFIPFACHLDPHTIITKNGELLQIIKISGFNFETVMAGQKRLPLREAIREAIRSTIKTNNFALWIQTVRRHGDLSVAGEFKDAFSSELNEAWKNRNQWQEKFTNELYISILIEGETLAITDLPSMMKSLNYRAEMKRRRTRIEHSMQDLDEAVRTIVEKLTPYGARRLGVYQDRDDGVYYSEPMSYLAKIINLVETPIPLAHIDASWVLHINEIAFGFNVVEVYHKNLGNYFGAVLSVKEYLEVAIDHIDHFLQLPMEFIITETFDFINNDKALRHFEKQENNLKVAGDVRLGELSGLSTILRSKAGNAVDFGEHQLTIMLLGPTPEAVDERVEEMGATFKELGILFIREDILMEDCFWAQLPGNFPFIKRMFPVAASNLGGYASLYNFPAGKRKENYWGPAVSVFYTDNQTPYFFNFHYEQNGHSVVLGPFGSGKTILLNFLLSQSRKYNNTLFVMDYNRSSEIFLRAIGGHYVQVIRKEGVYNLKFNPFRLEDTPGNRRFLVSFVLMLYSKGKESQLPHPCCYLNSVKEWGMAKAMVESLFSMPSEQRCLTRLIQHFLTQHPSGAEASDYVNAMTVWQGDGRFAGLIDGTDITQDKNIISPIVGYDMTQLIEENIPLPVVAAYMLHVLNLALDDNPRMLVLNEAWKILDNSFFSNTIAPWLQGLAQRNTMVVFCAESYDDVRNGHISKEIFNNTNTKLFLPSPSTNENDAHLFTMTDAELHMLQNLDRKKHQFLIKHHADTVVAELDLSGMDYLLAVLSSTPENIAVMENAMLDAGHHPEAWLPVFKKRMAV